MTLSPAVEALRRFYGRLAEPPRDPFAYFVWEVLSARTVPGKRDVAFAALKKIPALTPDAMWRLPQARLDAAVGLAGPYREQRLQAIRAGVDQFRRTPRLTSVIGGALVPARRALRAFPHLGEAGARRMLLFTGNHCVVPIDPRVGRVAARLSGDTRLAGAQRRDRLVQQAIRRELNGDLEGVRRTFLYLAHHGSATCTERDPHCSVCPLVAQCPHGQREISGLRWQTSESNLQFEV
jgi:endonuclease-3